VTGTVSGMAYPYRHAPVAETIWAWVMRGRDGYEEIAVADLPGLGPVALVVSDEDGAQRVASLAAEAARAAGRPAVLVRFDRRETLAIACPRCAAVSHSTADAVNAYCGSCRSFVDQG
jgi:hypothetical protein